MAHDLSHLALPVWQQPLPRRKQRGGRPPTVDRQEHGRILADQVQQVANQLIRRAAERPGGINPKLVFKLRLAPTGNLDDARLESLGLRPLARTADKVIVVFPDEETLDRLTRQIREFAGYITDGHSYADLAAIAGVESLSAADRVGPRLRARPLAHDERLGVDLELWHTGAHAEMQQHISEIGTVLAGKTNAGPVAAKPIRVSDSWLGETLCLLRAYVDQDTLDTLLELDIIKEIERRPEPYFEMAALVQLSLGDFTLPDPIGADKDSIGVLVIDSGVMRQHPLLRSVIGDAQVFPHRTGQVTGTADDGDTVQGGHGTAVAGIAVYGDVAACIERRIFAPGAALFSARVTDEFNQYDEDELLEHQLDDAVRYFLTHYPRIRVVNISLGNIQNIYDDGRYQFRFAAVIDELAYRYRDQEVVFVVSSGNATLSGMTDEDINANYPQYLLDHPEARLCDPATAALALTVGGLSKGPARPTQATLYDSSDTTDTLVAGEMGWPYPFTRRGPGIQGSIKPELVEFAGDAPFQRGRIHPGPLYGGIPTTARDFGPAEATLFRMVAGTSFAAPRVANQAAQLFREYPDASSNLVRVLLGVTAELAKSMPQALVGKSADDESILRIYGYGQPNLPRALSSSRNDFLLLVDDTIALDEFQLFLVPSLPDVFFTKKGRRTITTALAYDPPTRHTRADNYLGVTMQFALYRNREPAEVADALRAWARTTEETEQVPTLDSLKTAGSPHEVKLLPGPQRRRTSTLQRGDCHISKSDWRHDGRPLVLAVICRRKWAPPTLMRQRFAVAVSLRHDDPEVDLYTPISLETPIFVRTRARLDV